MLNVGVIGYGYWGPNLVRNFMASGETRVTRVCDMSQARLDKVAALYPGISLTPDPQELIADSRVDAVVIATPVDTHYHLAMAALKAGKHVLVEKPVATCTNGRSYFRIHRRCPEDARIDPQAGIRRGALL
jgi:predicted dehydrogenase